MFLIELFRSDIILINMKSIEQIKKVGLILKHSDKSSDTDNEVNQVAQQIGTYLSRRFGALAVCEEDKDAFDGIRANIVAYDDIAGLCDLIIVIGGDGTLLKVSRACAEEDTPVIGINLGRLGFLVEITPNNFETELDQIFAGHYKLEKRAMLATQHRREDTCLGQFVACNDVAIRNKDTVRMVELDTTVDDVFLNTVWSDGLIIATPTGSTAYALSSGGPLLEPTMEATLLVPICPHTLSNRPIVVDWHKVIEVKVNHEPRSDAVVAIDGQLTRDLMPGDRLVIKPFKNKLTLIQPSSHDYFGTLRTKLKWSEKL